MAISFRRVNLPPLQDFSEEAPDGAIVGLIGEERSGAQALLSFARENRGVRYIGPSDRLAFGEDRLLLIDHAFARHDAFERAAAAIELERLRRAGATVLLVSHEEPLLMALCDELWWLRDGKLAGRGEPRETWQAYQRHIAGRIRAWGESTNVALSPSMRRGDGRAEVLEIDLLGEAGQSTSVWRSGELAQVRVTVRFRDAANDPVCGIMIRTRIGLNVYGTNTELEKVRLGPRSPGETIRVSFGFRCALCPGEYSVTAASHDPDGIWHDWLEDAVSFSVTDDRYTAGVANLRASAAFELIP
jgi:lipopolysaccharide transport system ATP-binding protein